MANRHDTRPEEGETRAGSDRGSYRGVFYVQSGTKTGTPGNPACILLDSCDTNGAIKTWALWVTSAGKVRVVEVAAGTVAAAITDEINSGTLVGGQT